MMPVQTEPKQISGVCQSEHGKELNINPFMAMCNAECNLWTCIFDVGKYN
jgi:hypothetical protein